MLMFQQVTNVDMVYSCLIPMEETNSVIISGGSHPWSINKCYFFHYDIEYIFKRGRERQRDGERGREIEREGGKKRKRKKERQRQRQMLITIYSGRCRWKQR